MMPLVSLNFLGSRILRSVGTAFSPALIFVLALSPIRAFGFVTPDPDKPIRSYVSVLPSVEDRLSAQNNLFAQQYQNDLSISPEGKTAVGDYSDNARLDDYSLAASARQNVVDRAYLRKIRAISAVGFPEQDRISHDLFIQVLQERIIDYELKQYEMPISQMGGVQSSLADLPNAVPLDSVQHYEDYIARLRQTPRVFQQTIAVLRQGEKDGLMPPRILLDQVRAVPRRDRRQSFR